MTHQGHPNGGRADGAPETIEFDEAETDISDIKWIDAPGILVFWVLAIVVFLQFYTRYVLNDSLIWTEEAARYLLILACFVGSVSAVRRGSHITLEFFIRAAPRKLGKAMAVLSQLITFGFFGTLTWIGVGLTQKTRQQMVSLPIPKAWIYTICVISLGIMTIYAAIWLWRRLRQMPEEIIQSLDTSLGTD
jgi:TRAP-type C4-dicarboxylate transport system permease small subunit